MDSTFRDHLYEQCFGRISALIDRRELPVSVSRKVLARQARRYVLTNSHRLPVAPVNPKTGIPDRYIDTVLRALHTQKPRLMRLKHCNRGAWQEMLGIIYKRVRPMVITRYQSGRMLAPVEEMVEDLVQQCVVKISQRLDSFPMDTTLEQWVNVFVSYEVLGFFDSADFRHNQYADSLDASLTDQPDSASFGEMRVDERALRMFDEVEARLLLERAVSRLSPLQQAVIQGQLAGWSNEDMARELGCTRNAIYSIRRRAMTALRDSLLPE